MARRGSQKLVDALFARSYSTGSKFAARAGEEVAAVSSAHRQALGVLDVPARLLMGPGPGNAHPRVLAAQSLPLLGHMHPPMFKIMDDIQEGLRYLFQTDSKYTLMTTGSGHSGMEACIANLLEPGERIVVGNNGIWGARVADLSARYGGVVTELKVPAGQTFDFATLKAAVEANKPKVLFLVQGESSAGTHQSLAGLGELCKANGTLLVVDTVCTLGGVPMFADKWGVDAIYSGSQKCLSGPPGAAPLFLSDAALAAVQARKTPVRSYNLDLNLVGDQWGWFGKRFYHHTTAISTLYAMREALALVSEEGLEPLWQRHCDMHKLLWEGLAQLKLEPYVQKEADRLITVNTIKVPEGVDWAAVCKNAMDKYSVEIAGGLGPTAGQIWRVGLMGFNCRPQNVETVLTALEDGLKQQGRR